MIPRIIPCLLLQEQGVVKTIGFRSPRYIGDAINTLRIFNEKEVDEIVILDIDATPNRRRPDFRFISQLASECFMPLAYGGGVASIEDMRALFACGVEKVVLNTAAYENPDLLSKAAAIFGSQSITVSIDCKRTMFGSRKVYVAGGRKNTGEGPSEYAARMVACGAGEILLNDISRDGTRAGYDLNLIHEVSAAVRVPLVACGGAGALSDLRQAVRAGASAAAAGSLFVFCGGSNGILVNYPERVDLVRLFSDADANPLS